MRKGKGKGKGIALYMVTGIFAGLMASALLLGAPERGMAECPVRDGDAIAELGKIYDKLEEFINWFKDELTNTNKIKSDAFKELKNLKGKIQVIGTALKKNLDDEKKAHEKLREFMQVDVPAEGVYSTLSGKTTGKLNKLLTGEGGGAIDPSGAAKIIDEELEKITIKLEPKAEQKMNPNGGAAFRSIADTVPLSIPEYQHAAVAVGIEESHGVDIPMDLLMITLSQKAKARPLARIEALLQPYEEAAPAASPSGTPTTGPSPSPSPAPYRDALNKIMDEAELMAQEAVNVASENAGEGESEHAQVELLALQVKMLALQTQQNAQMIDILRDVVRMTGTEAMMNVEPWTTATYENMDRFRKIQERIGAKTGLQ